MSNAESSYPSNHVSDGGKSARLIDRLGRKFVLAQLARLQSGQLILKDCEEQHCLGAEAGDAPRGADAQDPRNRRQGPLEKSVGGHLSPTQ